MAVNGSYGAKGNKYKFQLAEVILFEYFITVMEREDSFIRLVWCFPHYYGALLKTRLSYGLCSRGKDINSIDRATNYLESCFNRKAVFSGKRNNYYSASQIFRCEILYQKRNVTTNEVNLLLSGFNVF